MTNIVNAAPLIDGEEYPLLISELLESKIRFLCNKFKTTEWSGVLFYKVTDDLTKDNCKIMAEDVLLMDIGSTVSTSFKLNPIVTNYMVKNNLLDYNIGLIHSHHQMETFFSGTDISTLISESKETNHFLSVIVNNAGTYNGYITKKVTYVDTIKRRSNFKSFDDKELHEDWSLMKTCQALEKCRLNIEIPVNIISVDEEELNDRIDEIQKENAIDHSFPVHSIHKIEIDYTFTKEYIKYLSNQIVCCSVLPIRNSNKFKLKIKNILDKRFKDSQEYKNYMEALINFLFAESFDKQKNVDFYNYTRCLSKEIIKNLKQEKFQHKYIDIIIKLLEEYI